MMTRWIIERGPTGEYPQTIINAYEASEGFDTDATKVWFQRAMDSNDKHESLSGVIGIAGLESKWGSSQKAIELLLMVVAENRFDAIYNYGIYLFDQDRDDEAEQYFLKAINPAAEEMVRANAYNALGCVEFVRENLAQAKKYFEKASELNDINSRRNLATIALDEGLTNIARSWLWEVRDDLDAKVQYENLTYYLLEDLKKPWCLPEILTDRARDFDVRVRREVAGNKNTPQEVLKRLSLDDDASVSELAKLKLGKENT
jgi:tetratricopeptide (TPR) repeat protein